MEKELKFVKINFKLNYADEFDMEAIGVLSSATIKEYNKKLSILSDLCINIIVCFGSNESIELNPSEFKFLGSKSNETKENKNIFLRQVLDSIDDTYEDVLTIGVDNLKSKNLEKLNKAIKFIHNLLSLQDINYEMNIEGKDIVSFKLAENIILYIEKEDSNFIFMKKDGKSKVKMYELNKIFYEDCEVIESIVAFREYVNSNIFNLYEYSSETNYLKIVNQCNEKLQEKIEYCNEVFKKPNFSILLGLYMGANLISSGLFNCELICKKAKEELNKYSKLKIQVVGLENAITLLDTNIEKLTQYKESSKKLAITLVQKELNEAFNTDRKSIEETILENMLVCARFMELREKAKE